MTKFILFFVVLCTATAAYAQAPVRIEVTFPQYCDDTVCGLDAASCPGDSAETTCMHHAVTYCIVSGDDAYQGCFATLSACTQVREQRMEALRGHSRDSYLAPCFEQVTVSATATPISTELPSATNQEVYTQQFCQAGVCGIGQEYCSESRPGSCWPQQRTYCYETEDATVNYQEWCYATRMHCRYAQAARIAAGYEDLVTDCYVQTTLQIGGDVR